MNSDSPQYFPLLRHASLEAMIAYRKGCGITVRQWIFDVHRVSRLLPEGGHLLNLCSDPYRFMVGLAAGMLRNNISLLTSSHTPGMLNALMDFAPDTVCLSDGRTSPIELPLIRYPEDEADSKQGLADPHIPEIEATQRVAYVFTSGSTGVPLPHLKTWGALVKNVRAEAERLGIDGRGFTLISTVSPKHMYGFESSVLLAMQSGGALCSSQTFYPLDICSAIHAAPRPRMLVSTPFHLRSLMVDGLDVPPVDLLLSATAPISPHLVREAEARFAAPLMEIYGSTESGQIACRQPSVSPEWRLFPQVRLSFQNGRVSASGGHVTGLVELGDDVRILAEDRFLLLGRIGDLVNIAGIRSSLSYLNHQLQQIPGVRDGVFYMPPNENPERVTRLAAMVVAPGLDAQSLNAALRECIHPAFLPRPLLFVDSLPRNETSKLPTELLNALVQNTLKPPVLGDTR